MGGSNLSPSGLYQVHLLKWYRVSQQLVTFSDMLKLKKNSYHFNTFFVLESQILYVYKNEKLLSEDQ